MAVQQGNPYGARLLQVCHFLMDCREGQGQLVKGVSMRRVKWIAESIYNYL